MIFVECNPDIVLLRALTNVPKRNITHEFKGKAEICKKLSKLNDCLALLDEDPSSIQPSYLIEATLEREIPTNGLRVLHDGANNNYLVILCPRLEDWVLNAAREANIDVRNYNLPTDASRLHRHINLNLDKFEHLLKDLIEASSRLKTLKTLLQKRGE